MSRIEKTPIGLVSSHRVVSLFFRVTSLYKTSIVLASTNSPKKTKNAPAPLTGKPA